MRQSVGAIYFFFFFTQVLRGDKHVTPGFVAVSGLPGASGEKARKLMAFAARAGLLVVPRVLLSVGPTATSNCPTTRPSRRAIRWMRIFWCAARTRKKAICGCRNCEK